MTKKIIAFIMILLLVIFLFSTKIYAASIPLESIDVTTSESTITAGDEVTITIDFGVGLGAYTFDIAYDDIFEYVSTNGGTENDDGSKVRVSFYDSSGGTNPNSSMTITFRAKSDIETTTTGKFSITSEGMANNDASQEYDDITTPIEKEVTVEPKVVVEDNNNDVTDENAGSTENNDESNETESTTSDESSDTPEELPKTGTTKYGMIGAVMALLISGYIVTKNYKK